MRLWLSVIAYNLGNLWRRLVLPHWIDNWSLTSLQQRHCSIPLPGGWHILLRYAVLALLLLPFRNLRQRRLLVCAILALAFSVVYPFAIEAERVRSEQNPVAREFD